MNLKTILNQHNNAYQASSTSASLSDATLTVSFVIPVYNSAETISQCVLSILGQHRADLIKEIILVDDGSSDDSPVIAQSLEALYEPVQTLQNSRRRYAAYTRNRGIEKSTGDLICFIDSDIILPPDYTYQHIIQHQLGEQYITFSLRSNVSDISEVDFPIETIEGDFRHKLLSGNPSLHGVSFAFCDTHTLAELCLTCAVTYRRSDLLQVKGCPENFKGWGFNDTAMAAKVIALRRSVVPIYSATVAHIEHAPRSGRTTTKWSEFAKNKRRYITMLGLPLESTCDYHVEALEI